MYCLSGGATLSGMDAHPQRFGWHAIFLRLTHSRMLVRASELVSVIIFVVLQKYVVVACWEENEMTLVGSFSDFAVDLPYSGR
jgi:hypothetical protein